MRSPHSPARSALSGPLQHALSSFYRVSINVLGFRLPSCWGSKKLEQRFGAVYFNKAAVSGLQWACSVLTNLFRAGWFWGLRVLVVKA